MDNSIKFGKLLEALLSARGWSAAKLAKELNVDPSYVRKWIRGERVPSLQSNYVRDISMAVTAGLISGKNHSIEKIFTQTLNGIGLEAKEGQPLSKLILDSMTQAQIHSLSLDSEHRKNRTTTGYDQIARLTESSSQLRNPFGDKPSDIYRRGVLSDIPMIIHGRENIQNAAISIVNAAIERKNIDKVDILLTFQGERDIFQDRENTTTQFDYCINNALKNGLDVYHIFRLNKNINRSLKIVEKIVNFKESEGSYRTFYFNKYGTANFPMELILVKGTGALVLFTSNGETTDTAFFYSSHDADAIDALIKHYQLLLSETSSLVEAYQEEDFYNYVTETDKRMGSSFSLQIEFGSLSCPSSLWERYLSRTLNDPAEINQHMSRINSRLQSFHEQVERYPFAFIVSKKSIERMIQMAEYNVYNRYRKSTPEDIVEHLENVIALLYKYENYRIALLSEDLEKLIEKTTWNVKGDYYVILDVNKQTTSSSLTKQSDAPQSQSPLTIFLIKETTIANAFKEYFNDIWDRLPEINKDKQYVIQWLEEQVDLLRSRLSH